METELEHLGLCHPFTCLIAGPSQSGKTHFVKRLLQQKNSLIDTPIEDIIWCYGEHQPWYHSFHNPRVRFVEGLIDHEQLSPEHPHLVIIDDLMHEADKRVVQFFTKGAHHRNTSVCYLVQNLFHGGKDHRTISLNCHYMVLFKNPRDGRQVEYLANQMFPKNSKYMLDGYRDATRKPYGYLFVDMKQNTPDPLRLRGNILNGIQEIYMPQGIKVHSDLQSLQCSQAWPGV